MAEAPLINVATLVDNQVASTEGSTDNLILAAADSCGLLGTAQAAVDEIAAGAANAADAAINSTIESVGNLSKKVNQFASESASAARTKLDATVTAINAKIQLLFNDAEEDPDDPDKQSALANFVAAAGALFNSIGASIARVAGFVKDLALSAFNSVNKFLFGDPEVEGDKGFVGDVLKIANDARIMACNRANAALSAVGSGLGGAFNSMAASLSDDKSPEEIIKERNSTAVKAKADAATAGANATNDEAAAKSAETDQNTSDIDSKLDQLQALAAE
jgi:hypothetical protein